MRKFSASDAKNKLGILLDRVETGEEVIITGKAIARLVPNVAGINRERAVQAVARIVSRRSGVTLGGLGIIGLVSKDHR
jgi:antitoxin (DNA-binding transcriptional repressor) of toxin-antitoxin stability system